MVLSRPNLQPNKRVLHVFQPGPKIGYPPKQRITGLSGLITVIMIFSRLSIFI